MFFQFILLPALFLLPLGSRDSHIPFPGCHSTFPLPFPSGSVGPFPVRWFVLTAGQRRLSDRMTATVLSPSVTVGPLFFCPHRKCETPLQRLDTQHQSNRPPPPPPPPPPHLRFLFKSGHLSSLVFFLRLTRRHCNAFPNLESAMSLPPCAAISSFRNPPPPLALFFEHLPRSRNRSGGDPLFLPMQRSSFPFFHPGV